MFKSLSSLFKSTPSYGSDTVFDFLRLIKKWPEIVGPSMGKHTIPLKHKNRCLYILSNHSAFSEAVNFMEEAIKKKIYRQFPTLNGSIDKLIFQVNSKYFDQRKHMLAKAPTLKKVETLHPYSPIYQQLKQEADLQFREIEDDEIRDKLISIYIQGNKP